jgi:hypothetical protein
MVKIFILIALVRSDPNFYPTYSVTAEFSSLSKCEIAAAKLGKLWYVMNHICVEK